MYVKIIYIIIFILIPATLPAVDFPLPDTGQTKCYDNDSEIPCPAPGEPFYGQDAQYEGLQPAYQDNGDGTVTDQVTGLMWQQAEDGTRRDWQGAIDYCADLTLGDHTDWRLPEIYELETLVDYSIPYPGPTIDMSYFPNTVWSYYWSSTAYAFDTDGAWSAYFDGGHGYDAKSSSLYVRCVRGGQGRSLGHLALLDRATGGVAVHAFVDEGDGTVSDADTGLIWQQQDDGINRTWQDALAYCEDFFWGGRDDWRLPNIRELKSIVDYTEIGPSIDSRFFSNTVSSDYWSSTTSASYTDGAWYVHFNNGHDSYYSKSSSRYVRCVHGAQGGPFDHLTLSVAKSGAGSGRVSSGDGDIDCGDNCAHDYGAIEKVTLTATPDTGAAFHEWLGACSGTDKTCEVTLDGEKIVYAVFELKDCQDAFQNGRQICIENPASCGLFSQTELDKAYQQGCTECDDDDCQPATISNDLFIHVPTLFYYTQPGTGELWVDFEFYGQEGETLLWKLKEVGQK